MVRVDFDPHIHRQNTRPCQREARAIGAPCEGAALGRPPIPHALRPRHRRAELAHATGGQRWGSSTTHHHTHSLEYLTLCGRRCHVLPPG